MEKLDIDYKTLTSFKEAITFLEDNALQLERSYQMLEYLIKVRDNFDAAGSKQKLQWECEYARLEFRGEKLVSFTHVFHKDLNFMKFPDLQDLDKKGFEYLIERADSTTNPLLKAKLKPYFSGAINPDIPS